MKIMYNIIQRNSHNGVNNLSITNASMIIHLYTSWFYERGAIFLSNGEFQTIRMVAECQALSMILIVESLNCIATCYLELRKKNSSPCMSPAPKMNGNFFIATVVWMKVIFSVLKAICLSLKVNRNGKEKLHSVCESPKFWTDKIGSEIRIMNSLK